MDVLELGGLTGVSVIVPTYQEALNIPPLVERMGAVRAQLGALGVPLELLFMDDSSGDGSVEAVDRLRAEPDGQWVQLVERTGPRGLGHAVVEGFQRAKYPVLVCMDCDLSHPPEKLHAMLLALASGQDMVVGSRYVRGGSTDDDWGFLRWLNSRIATLLAAPLTGIKDPMSGFFAMRKADFDRAEALNPIGYKIALELIVKCDLRNVVEVPIHFANRTLGESKLTFAEQLKYLAHIRLLYIHRFANAMYLLQFMAVGASGALVNFAVLTLLLLLGAAKSQALLAGILVSMVSNFLLNRRFTFSYARDRNVWTQFAGFAGASALGMAINYSVALSLTRSLLPDTPWAIYAASAAGIASGMLSNFVVNRFMVFRHRHVRKR